MKNKLNVPAGMLDNWNPNQVNPCYWDSIRCENQDHVTSVMLSSMGLTGTLSESIGTLKYLQVLILSDNKISGPIPEAFGKLTSLQKLNLEHNNLSGKIPSSLGNIEELEFLVLGQNKLNGSIPESLSNLTKLSEIFTGNLLDCGTNFPHSCASDNSDSGKSHTTNVGIILGSITGAISLFCFTFLILYWKMRMGGQKRDAFVDVEGEDHRRIAFGQLKRFSWRELQLATDNFSEKNVLGRGGFGKVYKGVLADNTKVAVKRLKDHEAAGGETSFLREIEMISLAVHRNLLKLIGFCTTPTERLLVYPFMQNLSVAHHLRELEPGEPILDWPARKRIALGTARGLEYLHEQCNPKIIHRDVKADNVLLDENFEAIVGDFGLAKSVEVTQTSVTTQIRGTMGHIAPEYLQTGKSSERTDIFGYGIMLLELVTGQRAIKVSGFDKEHEVLLLDHVKKLEQEKRIDDIADGNLDGNYDILEVEMMIRVALLCAEHSPDNRPSMSEVVRMLEGEGLAERWEERQEMEVSRRHDIERLQRRFAWGLDSIYDQDAVELSGGR